MQISGGCTVREMCREMCVLVRPGGQLFAVSGPCAV